MICPLRSVTCIVTGPQNDQALWQHCLNNPINHPEQQFGDTCLLTYQPFPNAQWKICITTEQLRDQLASLSFESLQTPSLTKNYQHASASPRSSSCHQRHHSQLRCMPMTEASGTTVCSLTASRSSSSPMERSWSQSHQTLES